MIGVPSHGGAELLDQIVEELPIGAGLQALPESQSRIENYSKKPEGVIVVLPTEQTWNTGRRWGFLRTAVSGVIAAILLSSCPGVTPPPPPSHSQVVSHCKHGYAIVQSALKRYKSDVGSYPGGEPRGAVVHSWPTLAGSPGMMTLFGTVTLSDGKIVGPWLTKPSSSSYDNVSLSNDGKGTILVATDARSFSHRDGQLVVGPAGVLGTAPEACDALP